MIVYLRILSDEINDFVKEIAIDDNQTFGDLHNFIQEILKYDATQMASFFTTDKEWNKEMEITLFDMTDGESNSLRVMQETIITEYIYEIGQRLLYVFDFFSERAFFMEVVKTAEGNLDKAMCYRNEGSTPDQIKIGDLTGNLQKEKMDWHDDEFDGSLNTLDFKSLEDIDLDSENLGY